MQTQNNQMQNAPNSQMDDDEVNLIDILLVIAKYNRFIIIFTAISAILAFVYALRQPVMFSSKVVIMAPAALSPASMIMGQLNSLGLGGVAGTGGGASPLILFKSRKLGYRVVERLKLNLIYKVQDVQAAQGILAANTHVESTKDGLITLECFDANPKTAALIAKAYVEELDKHNEKTDIEAASRIRVFYESQIRSALDRLADAEIALKEAQKNTDFTPIEVQSGAFVGLVANLREQITAKEIELINLRGYATEQNPAYRKANLALAILRDQLEKLEGADQGRKKSLGKNDNSKKTGSEYLHKVREVKYQEVLLESLRKQYEVARLNEAKDANLIQVIDDPLVAKQPSKPQRGLIVSVVAMVAMLVAILLAFLFNMLEQARLNPQSALRLDLLRRYLKFG